MIRKLIAALTIASLVGPPAGWAQGNGALPVPGAPTPGAGSSPYQTGPQLQAPVPVQPQLPQDQAAGQSQAVRPPVARPNLCQPGARGFQVAAGPQSRVPGAVGLQPQGPAAQAPAVTQVTVTQGSAAAGGADAGSPRAGGGAQTAAARPEPEELSRIELAFNRDPLQGEAQRAGAQPAGMLGPFGQPLRQFGYTMFAADVSTFAPVDDIPVGPEYVLGPGDNLTINVWGAVDSTIVRTVDRNGRIVLPKVGDLRVWGLTFSQADRLIREQLGRYFRGFQTSVTMGRLRTVRVHVVGEVCQPGVYTLSSLATVTNALYAAGGPSKLGSLRDVRLLRNGYEVGRLDLYDFLLRGDRTRDFRLASGDTIFVPTIGDVAAVTGEVKRPAIYEVRGAMRLADLVEMAGGITPAAYLKRVQIVRSQPSAERVTLDVDLTQFYLRGDPAANPPVNAGDLVLIHRSDPRVYNTVRVEGAVKYPGAYELKPMMRISQLLPAEKLLPEAYPDRVEVARRRQDLSVEILAVDLRKAWTGDRQQDIALKPLDEVTVRTELKPARTVTLAGQVARPGTYTIAEGERLSSVIERAGGFTDRAYLRGAVFTREALRRVEQEQLNQFMKLQEQRLLASASSVIVGAEKEELASQQAALTAQRELLRALASRVVLGRMVVRLDEPARLKGTGDDIVLAAGDSLTVPERPQSVFVIGSVRNSTSVKWEPDQSAEYYINRVGGFAKEADREEVHIVRADGSAVAGFTRLRTLEPGDAVVVPPKHEEKIRTLPTVRDVVTTVGQALLGLAAIAVLF